MFPASEWGGRLLRDLTTEDGDDQRVLDVVDCAFEGVSAGQHHIIAVGAEEERRGTVHPCTEGHTDIIVLGGRCMQLQSASGNPLRG
jgi:hypothetical protein